MADTGKLTGKVAIVTGASSGIGQGIALRYAQEGADVCINYFGDDAGAVKVQQEIQAVGRKAILFAADVSKPDQTLALVDAAWAQLGKADILVNNAVWRRVRRFRMFPKPTTTWC